MAEGALTLSAGTRLGPYEIVSLLGAGGMGEVYRAHDTRLERTVAIKVLPAERCASPEARQRFEREAKTISQLSHPHICALFDVGRHETARGALDYLVMEYLEGEMLSQRLAKGPLPLDQTLRFGIEIASALQRAHRQGVVHRDLKPANVMITRSGVKLLDFGLAKTETTASPASSHTALPTRDDLTQEGTILGTMQYMAPEQLEGKEADARSDIFALGAVLYEMATGKRAFSGSSQASLISSIMKDEPMSIAQVSPMIPPALDHVVKSCLRKDPEDRWQSANDVRNELSWIAEGGGRAGAAAPAVPAPGRRRLGEIVAWAAAVAAILLAAGLYLRGDRKTPPAAGSMRFSIELPDTSALRAAVISPDGTRMVAVARDPSGRNLLWLRSFDSLDLRPLPGTENASFPFWSPDGRFIGFFANGKLMKIETSGGPPQILCDAPLNRGGTWSKEGVILFSPIVNGPLYRVSDSGGTPVAVTKFDPARGETTHRWPYFLPDGRHFLFQVATFASSEVREGMGIYAGSLDSPEVTFLVAAYSSPAYAPPGWLLFHRDRFLFAQPFDTKALRTSGERIAVAEDIQFFPQIYSALYSVSSNGILLFQHRTSTSTSQLRWFGRDGTPLGLLGTPAEQANPRISPDGGRVSFDIIDAHTGNTDIWSYETSGGVATRLTSNPALDAVGTWSPDGKQIAFTTIREAGSNQYLYVKPSDGSKEEEKLLLGTNGVCYPMDWSPDGRFILYRVIETGTNLALWTVPLQGERKPVPFLESAYGVSHGHFSPDGRFVVYESNESGRWEIYVTPFPRPGANWKISADGGVDPRWRRDGKELFYVAPGGQLMSVEVRVGDSFQAETPKPLFKIHPPEPVSATSLFAYDVSADGQRFLVNTDMTESTSTTLSVVLNWAASIPAPK